METPDIVRYGDGYYWRTIYGIGPYIADYPEQVLLACIVQGWCPRWAMSSFSYQYIFYIYSVDAMQNGIIWMTISQDGAPTNWLVLLLRLWKKNHYGMTTALSVISWYIMAAYQTPACPYCFSAVYPWFSSCQHSRVAFPRPSPPNYQRNIQRSLGDLGDRLYQARAPSSWGQTDSCWHWPAASPLTSDLFL